MAAPPRAHRSRRANESAGTTASRPRNGHRDDRRRRHRKTRTWPALCQAGELVDKLHRAGARTIGIDILLADLDTPADAPFAMKAVAMPRWCRRSAKQAMSVPFAFEFGGAREKPTLSMTDVAYARLRNTPDFRALALAPTDWLRRLRCLPNMRRWGTCSSRSTSTARRLRVSGARIRCRLLPVDGGARCATVSRRAVGRRRRRAGARHRVGSDSHAHRSWNANAHRLSRTIAGVSDLRTFAGARRHRAPAVFRDRIVLLGANALGTRDTFVSPFTAVMPGVAARDRRRFHPARAGSYRPKRPAGSRRRSCSSPRWHWDLPYRDTRSQWGPFAPSCSWRSC